MGLWNTLKKRKKEEPQEEPVKEEEKRYFVSDGKPDFSLFTEEQQLLNYCEKGILKQMTEYPAFLNKENCTTYYVPPFVTLMKQRFDQEVEQVWQDGMQYDMHCEYNEPSLVPKHIDFVVKKQDQIQFEQHIQIW